MKILFMTFPLAFQSPGGGEQIILESKKALEALGHQVDLFNSSVHKVRDYDIVHYFSLWCWWDWRALKSYGRPLVVTPTSWASGSPLSKSIDKFKDSIRLWRGQKPAYSLRSYLEFPDHFLPTTPLEMELLANFYDISKARMSCVGNGVQVPTPVDSSSNEFIKEVGFKDYILFSGSIRPNKNVDLLIKACQSLGLNLVVMGEASFDTKDYERQCKQLAGSNVFFTGYVEKGSVRYNEVYNGAKCVAIPSNFETFCLAAAEGAAIGKSVIVPAEGGTKSVFKEHALYLNPSAKEADLVSLLEQMNSMSEDKLRRNGQALQEHITGNYSWTSIAKQLEGVYTKVI